MRRPEQASEEPVRAFSMRRINDDDAKINLTMDPTSTAAATGRTDGQHLRPSADRAPLVRDTHETDYKEAGAVGIGRAGVISPAATAVQLVRRPIRQHPARGILESWENLSTAIRAASSTTGLHPLPPPPPCFSSPALILQNLY